MMDFGWKKKTDRLKMVILSAAHQMAKELPAGTAAVLDIFKRVAKDGGFRPDLKEEFDRICVVHADDPQPLWEPVDIYGWKIQATMYIQNGQHWWLLHAVRRNEKDPSDKDIAVLYKVLDHLGADPKRDVIIGPLSGPASEPGRIPFGWWTWFNRWPLFEVQVNKAKRGKDVMRIVPLGSRETEGYQFVDLAGGRDEDPKEKP